MAKFRKKPVVIEAMYFGGKDSGTEILEWSGYKLALVGHRDTDDGEWIVAITIDTLEGTMRAEVGDWIIRGIKGEYYPCKPDIFIATYEPA